MFRPQSYKMRNRNISQTSVGLFPMQNIRQPTNKTAIMSFYDIKSRNKKLNLGIEIV